MRITAGQAKKIRLLPFIILSDSLKSPFVGCIKLLALIFLLTSLAISAQAQKEVNHWHFSPSGYMNFNTSPPEHKVLPYDSRLAQYLASISDAEGNLLFYTDGRTFLNSQRSIMENGRGDYEEWVSSQTSYIIPRPGSDHLYYNFITELSSTSSEFTGNGWTLHYSLVDVNANDGKGKVLIKNQRLNNGEGGDALTVFRGKDKNSFWVVSINAGGSEFHAYKVNQDGINPSPVVTSRSKGSGAGYTQLKASPDNNYLLVAGDHFQGYAHLLQVFTFDNATGSFSPKFELQHVNDYDPTRYPHSFTYFAHSYEFSHDSKNIFVVEEKVEAKGDREQLHDGRLLKYELDVPNNQLFEASREKLFDFPAANYGNVGSMQLSPDGRILIGSHQDFVSAINLPESCGEITFTYKALVFNTWPGLIPSFPAFYFRKSGSSFQVEAPDIEACPGSTALLQAPPTLPDHHYEWTNTKTSEKLFGPEHQLTIPPTALSVPDTTFYYLKVTDPAGCNGYDSLRLVTLPSRELSIQGSRSVCPGVQEVAYWVEGIQDNSAFNWTVEGGEIAYGQGSESIAVNWHGPNPDAYVRLRTTNRWGCEDRVTDLRVKVFKELETEKPRGRDTLSCDTDTYTYSIPGTNGSQYHWKVINGEILDGQGSAAVKVTWNKESPQGYLWIEENVNTSLEVCFGRSDTLIVVNPEAYGSQNIAINYVSGVLQTPEVVQLRYEIKNPQFYGKFLTVLKKEAANPQAAWVEAGTVSATEKEVTLAEPLIDRVVYDYKIRAYNLCGAPVESAVHNNIVLKGEIDENLQIQLSWNPYLGWRGGVKSYTLYRKLDEADTYSFISTIEAGTRISLDNLWEGFDHCFYIKANTDEDNGYSSISNQLCLSYDHPVFIPNVITPNGDDKNESLVISMLELYHQNELKIYNRHGKLVYEKRGYANDWNAEGLPGGTYYYHFFTHRNQKNLRGWIQVIR